MLKKILRNDIEKFLTSRWRCKVGKGRLDRDIDNLLGQSPGKNVYIGSTQGQAMIGRRAGDSGRGFDHVKATHRVDNAFRNYCSVQELGRYGPRDCGIDFLGFVQIAT